jgi:hypothetical protein
MTRSAHSPAMRMAFLALLGLTIASLAGQAAGEAPGGHRIFLSAGAPWGEPGARTTLRGLCADTVARDTLYLSFEPARDDSAFLTASGDVYFYAQPGDTLGDYWQMEKGGRNNGGLVIQFGPDESFPQPQPWTVPGLAVVKYERTRQSGCFRFVFAVPMTHPGPVKAGTRYVIGRIVLGAAHAGLGGCERPVCVEWHTASLGFKGRPMEFTKLGDSRWLTRGEAGEECRERIPAWRPKAAGGATTSPRKPR